MSRWTHAICDPCWDKHYSPRLPVRLNVTGNADEPAELCCFCGRVTLGGIFVRADPSAVKCKGEHDENQ